MAALACPFKPVPQRERMEHVAHVHDFEVETLLDDPTCWVQDCACGARQRVRKNAQGGVVEMLSNGLASGGSLENVIFQRQPNGAFVDRWAITQ